MLASHPSPRARPRAGRPRALWLRRKRHKHQRAKLDKRYRIRPHFVDRQLAVRSLELGTGGGQPAAWR
jgi:hypothetical protein